MSRREQQESGAIEPRRRRSQPGRAEAMPTFNPFSMIRRIAEDMDRLFEGAGLPALGSLSSRGLETFTPQIDIFKQDGKLVVRADLPGVDLDDVTAEYGLAESIGSPSGWRSSRRSHRTWPGGG